MSVSELSDERLSALYEALKAPGGKERLRRAFEVLGPWFDGYLEGLRDVAIEVARAKQGGLEPGQEDRIQRLRDWKRLQELVVGLASAGDAASARTLIDAF
jgi:hypothetical protein